MAADPPFRVVFFPLEFPFAISPIISMIANALVLITFVFVKKSANPLHSMIFAVNLMDLLFCLPKVLSMVVLPSSTLYCHVFQTMAQCAMQSSMLCSAFFGHAFWIFSKDYKFDRVRQLRKYYFMICMLVPLLVAICSFIDPYAEYDSEKKCVLHIFRNEVISNLPFLMFFCAPIITSITLSIIFYIMAANNLRRFVRTTNANNLLTLIIYPAIIIVCWMPISITNAVVILGGNPSKYFVLSIQFLAHLQGLFEAIVYSQSKTWLKAAWRFLCCYKADPKSQIRPDTQAVTDADVFENGGRTYSDFEMERSKSDFSINGGI